MDDDSPAIIIYTTGPTTFGGSDTNEESRCHWLTTTNNYHLCNRRDVLLLDQAKARVCVAGVEVAWDAAACWANAERQTPCLRVLPSFRRKQRPEALFYLKVYRL